jgi:hypothetical protein
VGVVDYVWLRKKEEKKRSKNEFVFTSSGVLELY